MNYSYIHSELKNRFSTSIEENIQWEGVRISWFPFRSASDDRDYEHYALREIRRQVKGGSEDENFLVNNQFHYPAFIPLEGTQKGCIILLHGLNERKWNKYLSWAHYLAAKTGKTVLLFPISFHQDRGPAEWIDPRIMQHRSENRQRSFGSDPQYHSFINQALSARLSETPERFFLSGLQTAGDLVELVKAIHSGQHPLFGYGTQTDFFAYSIGGLLGQVLLAANPYGYLSDSKLFLFCAGSAFSEMNGVSKLILDPPAHERIQHYYQHELNDIIKKPGVFREFFYVSKIGTAFRSLIAPDNLQLFWDKVYSRIRSNISAISMKNDRVIPPHGIEKVLGKSTCDMKTCTEMDFGYAATHEQPFPTNQKGILPRVDQAFEKIFSRAAAFLS